MYIMVSSAESNVLSWTKRTSDHMFNASYTLILVEPALHGNRSGAFS
jgi:hypothetical protein